MFNEIKYGIKKKEQQTWTYKYDQTDLKKESMEL